ncbi:MAG: Crp/Fnr family transcriptional regulator [Phreatobacter sp.]|uniref:Crp/Fnr family transcriptional regulator n=1 Tax=Phreatobacter sp. TaxID=1966341 RepID=UPI00273709B3|nr:Crp/Fnr family transcriptional regulator [Phreatobacter sp.]MDP2800968.1 Crp/Fnr family transcriptional regulator [Phreatobacter sp.]
MSENNPALEILSRHPWFGKAGDQLASLAGRARAKAWTGGQTIFQRRENADTLVILVSGLVRLSLITEEGREVTVRMAAAGEVFGELGILDGEPRSTDATALTKVAGFTLAREDVWGLIEASSPFRKAVIGGLCSRLRETTAQLESIALMSIETRVARLFHHLAVDRRKERGRVEVSLPYSQGELASLVGATRPKVNQAISQLLDRGALVRTKAGYSCHLEKLAELAQLDEI